MSSYLGPVAAIPTLPPAIIYEESQYPLRDQISELYTQIADIVNDKKRRDAFLQQELPTNDIWVDGLSVYFKTIQVPVLTAGATNNVAHGITGFKDLVFHKISVSNGTNRRLLGYASPTAANSASVDVTSTNIVIVTGAGFGANFAGWATLYYTKT